MFSLSELVFTQSHHIFTLYKILYFSGSVKLILQAYLKRKVQCRWGGEWIARKGSAASGPLALFSSSLLCTPAS